MIMDLRRKVLSAVDVRPLPHSEPGSTPTWPMLANTVPLAPPTRSTTASSPLNVNNVLVWLARAKTSLEAVLSATTYVEAAATVPDRLIV